MTKRREPDRPAPRDRPVFEFTPEMIDGIAAAIASAFPGATYSAAESTAHDIAAFIEGEIAKSVDIPALR